MKQKEIIIATRNKGKVEEFKQLLSQKYEKILSLLDFEDIPEIIEDRGSFSGNALKKAETISKLFNRTTVADDSGLVVESLGGEPGIYSARYAGKDASDDKNIEKLLENMHGIKNRNAKFVCALAIVFPDGKKKVFEGECHGEITEKKIGTNGFGYDPVFYLSQYKKTMAEIEPDIKNSISHRSESTKKLINYLR